MQKNPRSLARRRADRRRLHGQAAFTLVEVMIAFTIMIAVLCGSLTAMQSGYKAIDTARCSTLAAQIMQSQIEKLRLQNWSDIEGARGTDTSIPVADLVPASAAEVAGRFTLTQTIQTPTDGRTGIVDVSLKVVWTGVGGIAQTRTFVTRYSKNGLYDYYYSAPRS